jgi:hypothetical protein
LKQEDNEIDKILNIWSYWPSKHEGNIIEFELERFSFVFIGLSEFRLITGKENKDIQNKHKYIDPGLNYRISCENENCTGNQKLVIVKRGYGEVIPNIDILKNNDTKLLKCNSCDSLINQTTSIKGMILFLTEAKIFLSWILNFILQREQRLKMF